MTVGERIQMYRKLLEMSQEELGQKLLVSRQTISLWEHDQTVPTIDNLIRLREIFGVSVDDILGFEAEEKKDEVLPKEVYQFRYNWEELKAINHAQMKNFWKRPIIVASLSIMMILFIVTVLESDFLLGWALSLLLLSMVTYVTTILRYIKNWKRNVEYICRSIYAYKVFEDYLELNIYRDSELVRNSKFYFTDIERIYKYNNWLFLQFGGQAFIIRRSELRENSVFYSYMYKNPAKVVERSHSIRWNFWSIVLFVASLLSVLVAFSWVMALSGGNFLLADYMWICYLFVPIPVASIVLGFVLKRKNFKYKKNIIVGIIVAALLCVYGSFTFIFTEEYDEFNSSDEMVVKVEQSIGISIPEYNRIIIQDWTQGTQSVPRGYIYYTSYVHFDDYAVEEFEDQILDDDKWIRYVLSDMVGIMSPTGLADNYDYKIIYNIDTSEINTLPDREGTYRFMEIAYRFHDNQMLITEYDVDYVK